MRIDFHPAKVYYYTPMAMKKTTHGQVITARTGLCLLAMMWWLLAPLSGAFAGAPAPAEAIPGQTSSGGDNNSLLSAPVRSLGFLELLTVSPIGEGRFVGLGRSAVSDPSTYCAAGTDALDHGSFPDKSTSYLFSLENAGQDNRYVGLAWLDRFDATQTSRISSDEYRAELMIGYRVTSLGSILFGKGMEVERPGDTSLKLLDDGWRLKFVKKF